MTHNTAMGSRLRAWNECLATAAEGNDTLADMLADAGQLCFAAPGSTTEFQVVMRVLLLVFGAVTFLGAVAFLISLYTSMTRGAHERRAALEAGSRSSEAESTPLFAEAEGDEEQWHEKESDKPRSMGHDGKS
ncbi:uncharacterized protein LOC62_04G006429 [Vanrija pseudolonga]|uniref:Uncharacterized protein n=1 Tax=Vanrija pseudolonga TaxID=143232 RepID=A0AAF1BNB6_9TREE|nr:hypothetical protein LOC62_04G006429 [Vanrija pseudolonga]